MQVLWICIYDLLEILIQLQISKKASGTLAKNVPVFASFTAHKKEPSLRKLSVGKSFASCLTAVASVARTYVDAVSGAGIAAVVLTLGCGALYLAVGAGTCAVTGGGVCEGVYLVGKACALGILIAVGVLSVYAYRGAAAASVAVVDALYGIA